MDTKDLRGLAEAYSEVYAPQEVDEATAMAKRGYDEAPIRQKIAKSTGGGEAADRASALEKKSTFGDAKKAKQRQDLARKQRGDFRKTASSNPGLHVGQHKSDDPKVKAKQAARGAQRGALTPAEKKQFNREEFDVFDTIIEFLCVEGFAETLEEAEWMMANIINEEAINIILGEEKIDEADSVAAMRERAAKRRQQRYGKQGGGGRDDFRPYTKDDYENPKPGYGSSTKKESFELWLDEAMTNYEKNRKRAAMRAAMRNDARAQGKTGAVPGVGYVTPRKERETWTDESGKTRHAKGL